jgi:ligand-binding sensor domain-containing protein
LGNESGKVYNLNVYGNYIWASTEKGLYYSEDGEHWEKHGQLIDLLTGEEILSESVFSTYFSQSLQTLYVGTGDGLAIINESISNITRFWESPNPFSAYPNPFLINDHNQFDNDGHMRFIFIILMGL